MGGKACSDYRQEIKDALPASLNGQTLDIFFVIATRVLIVTKGI
ncbi:hypothetical protein Hfont_2118 [Herminiimonas fonticola]|nr:hypothetical protein Hfont_2118 [Herminiimonas fonticola]